MSLFRNSSFDAAGARARITQSKAGSQETEEEELHAHLHLHPHQESHLATHTPHSGAGNFHLLHLTSALHEIRGDSIPLTPVLSEDEDSAVEEMERSNEDSGLRMRIDKVPGDVSVATKSGQLRGETSDGESLATAACVREEHSLEGRADVKENNSADVKENNNPDVKENNNGYEGHQEKSVSIKHRGSI